MIFPNKIGFILLILKYLPLSSNGERTKDRMYIDIKSSTSCFRRLNATHQIGCTSNRGGATGVVHFCLEGDDLQFLLKNGTAGPYIPVVPVRLFSKKLVEVLEQSPKISGLLLYMDNGSMPSFTHDLECPNENFGVQGTCGKKNNQITWNPFGTGLIFEDISFPVFYIDNNEEILSVKNCFQKFNNYSFETQNQRPLCSVQLNSFMYGAKNTPTCIRRSNIATNLNPVRVCDPLGDKNIWASLFPLAEFDERNQKVKPITGKKYIVIAARIDTASMFDRTSGADSPVTGLVTVLTIAKILKEMLPKGEKYDTNVLFIFFNGESFDYIGSQRILYDMENGNFPIETENGTSVFLPVIKVEDISLFIELSQLSRGDGTLYAHRYRVDPKNTEFLKFMSNADTSISVETSNETLPPSSVQTFMRKHPNISTVVLTDHKEQYRNRFYNSIFDNASNINYIYHNNLGTSIQNHLLEVATLVASSVYQEVTGQQYDVQISSHLELVDELLHCYLENQSCKIYQAVWKQPQKQRDYPLNLYVGVDVNTNEASTLLGLILGWLTGDISGDSNQNCTNTSKNYAFRFYNMSVSMDDLNNTKCFRTVMNFTEAVSPAFIIDNYDWSSNLYSSWSESTWGDINMRLFLKPSVGHESMIMAVGSISLIFSFLMVYFIKSRAHILFTPESIEPSPVDC